MCPEFLYYQLLTPSAAPQILLLPLPAESTLGDQSGPLAEFHGSSALCLFRLWFPSSLGVGLLSHPGVLASCSSHSQVCEGWSIGMGAGAKSYIFISPPPALYHLHTMATTGGHGIQPRLLCICRKKSGPK